ncbi:Zinc finger CCHC-type [Arabidopsis suecica]|uniref:Zinc finger CCHC-type n=1 Tax=Arabidopsis suecica TaxID=45249 RepID=A0A8T2C1C9_ARASU|nr:Zinc finger CCHC-type [Arabidopsis suecica]
MGDKNSLLSIPKFDGDYEHWAMLMENLLRSKEWWDLIETGVSQPERNVILTGPQRTELAEMKLKDLKVKNYLFAAIDKTILKTIAKKDSSKDIWESMKTKYQGNMRVQSAQLQRLRRNFEVLEMKDGDTITTYFSRVMLVANDMRNLGEDMPDAKIVEKILRTLVEKFTYVVCAIEESKDITSLSVDELQSSLLVHEQNLSKHVDDDEEHALKIEGERGRGGYVRGRGRFQGGRGRGNSSFNKDNVECFKCHRMGHFKNECPSWERTANYVELDEDVLLMAQVNLAKAEEHVWYLDSGCSNHMCGTKEWFIDFDDTFRQHVKLGDDRRMLVEGKGNLRLEINGITQVISSVYFVPGLEHNLLSVGQLQQKGLRITIEDNICEIWHKQQRRMIMHSSMSTNKMFVIYATVKGPKDKEGAQNLQITVENIDGDKFLIDAGHEELLQSTIPIGEEERKEGNDEQGEGYGPEHIGEQREVLGPQSEAIVNGPSHKKKIESLQVPGSSSGAKRNKQKSVSMKDYGCDGMRSIIEEDGENSEELIAMFVAEEDPDKFEKTGKERSDCQDLSNDEESAEVCVKFAEACKEEEWLEEMRCELQAIKKNEACKEEEWLKAMRCELQAIEKIETGSLLPHMMYVACLISQFMAKSREEHMLAAKSVLTYLKGTLAFRRTQHIDVRYHYLCDLAKQEVVKLVSCGTEDQVADILTKPLRLEVFVRLKEKLGVCNRIN